MKQIICCVFIFILLLSLTNIFAEDSKEVKEDYRTEELKFLVLKCTLCHGLERIYEKGKKKPWEWATLVSWMQDKIPDVLSDEDVIRITKYLSEDGYLFDYRCTKCHSQERIFDKNYEYKKWEELVQKMQKKKNSWIKDEEVARIAFVISDSNKTNRHKIEREMIKNLLFLEQNINGGDIVKLLHSAESLNLCAEGLCKFPPLENSDDFLDFVDNLKQTTEDLKNKIKAKDVNISIEDVKRVRNACAECHGALNK